MAKNRKLYTVRIIETFSYDIQVRAKSEELAQQLALLEDEPSQEDKNLADRYTEIVYE